MGAGVMFICGSDTLILKRVLSPHDKWGGTWNFPGGKTEEGEDHYTTALRETYEELGGDEERQLIGSGVPYQIYDEIYCSGYTLYLAEVDVKFTPTINDEHIDWKWVPISDVLRYPLHPKDKKPFLLKWG